MWGIGERRDVVVTCEEGFHRGLGFGISIWGFRIQSGLTSNEGVDRLIVVEADVKGPLKTHRMTIYILIKFMPHVYSIYHINRFR